VIALLLALILSQSGFSQENRYSTRLPADCDSHCKSVVHEFLQEAKSNSAEWRKALSSLCYQQTFLDSLFVSHDLPPDFKYIPLVASFINPTYSDSFNRTGYWALSVVDALSHELNVDFVIDERRDFKKSSIAAARKLQNLYNIHKNPDSTVLYFFLEGSAPFEEERSYAIAKWTTWKLTVDSMKSDLAKHCQSKQHHPIEKDLVAVVLDTTIFFDCISRFCKGANNILQLNPVYYRGVAMKGDSILIPKMVKKCFDSLYAKIIKCSGGYYDREKVAITYKVRYGDNLSRIARRYGVTVRDIMRWNKLRSTRIYAGQRLVIYVSRNRVTKSTKRAASTSINKKTTKSSQLSNQYPGKTKTYIVKDGDTLFDIARRHNISLEKLMKVNDLSTDVIYPGQRLTIPLE